MADEWVGLVNTLREKYVKKVADLTVRNRIWLPALERRGRVSRNEQGLTLKWPVMRGQPPVVAYGDGGDLGFAAQDLWSVAELDWRGYRTTDTMTEPQKVRYGSETAIVHRFSEIMDNLDSAMRSQLGSELYVDGNAASNELRFHGAASWQANGTTVAADLVAKPSDTYAGLSCALGQYDGWTDDLTVSPNADVDTDWPEGGGNRNNRAGYDFWSPILANWSSTSWGTNSTAWIDNCEYVLSRVQRWLFSTAGAMEDTLFALLAGNLYSGLVDAMRARQREIVPHPEARVLGVPGQTLNFEGMLVKHEFGATANQGEIINFSKMKLNVLTDSLLVHHGPDWVPTKPGWLYQVGVMGNLMFESPKHFAHLENYA